MQFTYPYSLGLYKVCPSYNRSLQTSKENIQHFKKFLWVICTGTDGGGLLWVGRGWGVWVPILPHTPFTLRPR